MHKTLEDILNTATWAPSGDNSQPWFITIKSDTLFTLALNKFKTNFYNLTHFSDLIAIGTFLENATIAAQQHDLELNWTIQGENVEVTLNSGTSKNLAHLAPYITARSVNRFSYKLKKPSDDTKHKIEDTLPNNFKIHWLDTFSDRLKFSNICAVGTDIRLRMAQSYDVHKSVLDYNTADSADKMPAASLGLNPLSQNLSKWAFSKKSRYETLIKIPASTLSYQIELDYITGLRSAGFFILSCDHTIESKPQTYIESGQALQRFWLSLTEQKMVMQPQYIPLLFSHYIQDGITFTDNPHLQSKAKHLHRKMIETVFNALGLNLNNVFFMGRYGYAAKTPRFRSIRKNLSDLIIKDLS